MSTPLLADAFGHHAWATLRLIDACAELTPEQLQTSVPGTYGSILDTLRHMVGADSWYLFRVGDGRTQPMSDEEEANMDLAQLRDAAERQGKVWLQVVAEDLDADRMIVARRDDGAETHAPVGIRLAQALHHGTDHRSQVCTALTNLGFEPPSIDAWDYAEAVGRMRDVAPPG